MAIEIKVPSVGESVSEALLAQWFKNDGDLVKKDEPLFVIETDKVTLEVVAEADGVLSIKVTEGEMVAIGAVVGTLDSEGPAQAAAAPAVEKAAETKTETPATSEPMTLEKSSAPPASELSEPALPQPTPVPENDLKPSGIESQLAPSAKRLV
ncbi:MAG: dihydrolipoamide succinyltransferase, partial [Desulfobacterales bacterium]